jgi:hypothetical protein
MCAAGWAKRVAEPRFGHEALNLGYGQVSFQIYGPNPRKVVAEIPVGVWSMRIKAEDGELAAVSEEQSAVSKKFLGVGEVVECIHAENQIE